jgi:hypothetical protein
LRFAFGAATGTGPVFSVAAAFAFAALAARAFRKFPTSFAFAAAAAGAAVRTSFGYEASRFRASGRARHRTDREGCTEPP